MPSSPPEPLPLLSPAERQVLALLARGHTTKSIASALDLSIHAVNERLREARRKTGAASSRELARRLAAQENWDKQIGVPGHGLPDAEPRAPGAVMVARRWSRSLVIVFVITAVSALAVAGMQIASAPPTAPAPTQAASPLASYQARFDAEARDSDWAAPSELRAWALFALVDGVQSIEVKCAAKLCRVDGAVPPDAMKRAKAGVQSDALRDRLAGAGLKIVAEDLRTSPDQAGAGRVTVFLRRIG